MSHRTAPPFSGGLPALGGLVLVAALAGCSSAPPAPVEVPRRTVSAPSVGTASPPPAPRVFSDLGPPRFVPQLGVDAGEIALSPDGLLALTGGGQGDIGIQVWDVDRRIVVAELAPPPSIVQGRFGFAKDGQLIVAEGAGAAAVWDGRTGQLVGQIQASSPPPDFDYDRPTPEALYYDDAKKRVVLRTFEPGPEIFQVPVTGDAPWTLAISGERYVVQRETGFEVYDRNGKLVETLPPSAKKAKDGSSLHSTAFEPERSDAPPQALQGQVKDSSCLTAAGRAVCEAYEGDGKSVYVANLRAPEPRLEKLPARSGGDAVFRDEGAGLDLECEAGQFGTFGFEAGTEALAAAERRARLRAAAKKDAPGASLIETKGALLAAIDGRIAVWDVATGEKRSDLVHQSISRNSSVAPSPDGKLLAAGGEYGATQILLFDLERGTLLRTLDHGHSLWSLTWNPDGAVLVSTARTPVGGLYLADEDASIKLWSPRTGKLLRTFKGHYNATYTRDNTLFVTWDYGEVQVYAATTLQKLGRATGAYMYAIPSPDGKSMITPDMDTSAAHPGMFEEAGIDVRSTRTGAVLRSFGLKTGVVTWSPDSSRLLISSSMSWRSDSMSRSFDLAVFSVATGKREQAWSSPGAVQRAEFALSGKLVVTRLRGMARLSRTGDGASIWIQPVMAGGRCTAVAFDEATGRFEAEDAALPGLGFRLGDDLRRSDVVHAGPEVEALRAPGLYRSFIAAAR